MRQIKFRAKRVDNGQWVTGDLLTHHPHHGTAILEHGCINYAVDPESIGQFTEMEDKNGNEIYEGDILRVRHQKFVEPDLCLTQEVYYDGGCFCLMVNEEVRPIEESLGNVPMFWIKHPSFFEILGNKFDNPKL